MEGNVRNQMSLTCQCVNSAIDFIDASFNSQLIKTDLSDHTHTHTLSFIRISFFGGGEQFDYIFYSQSYPFQT